MLQIFSAWVLVMLLMYISQPYYYLQRCFAEVYAREHLIARKNKQGSSHLCSRKHTVAGYRYPKLKHCISELI
jgi:hypothetical protein